MAEVRVLCLNAKENSLSTLYRLKQGMVLEFRLGPTLLGHRVKVYTNCPEAGDDAVKFCRTSYRVLEWRRDSDNANDDTAVFIDLELRRSGSFRFYFETEGHDLGGEGYFVVDPVLRSGPKDETLLPLDCIQCQTVLAKNLGPFSTWEDKLKISIESGYNFLHFTPIQALGASKSAYSLFDQHALNPEFKTDFKTLEEYTAMLKADHGVFTLCDIVLNHTAFNSEWIKEQPDSTYNCANSPHLRPACMLDRALFRLAVDVGEGKWTEMGIPKGEVSTEEQLQVAVSLLRTFYLPKIKIKMEELYTVDVEAATAQFEKRLGSAGPPCSGASQRRELKLVQDPGFRRLRSSVDLDLAVQIFNANHNDISGDEERRIARCCSEFKKKLEQLNESAEIKVRDNLDAALNNVILGARYHRVSPDGPKVKKCSKSEPLVTIYFVGPTLPTLEEEVKEIMFPAGGRQYMACNGWVMSSDPLANFALPGCDIYLRRELVAWGDSVKLRFGEKPEDSPWLWNFMREYVEQTARIFDGIRLDNCHSTPIHVAEYMLDAARAVRPELYVIAELFTSSEGSDNVYINRLGINSLIREALAAWDSHEQGRLVHRFGGDPVGSFRQPTQRPLVPSMAHAILFDQTHDNESPFEKRSGHDLLPTSAMVSMTFCAVGSNRGYDEMVPHHIHVVNEARTYAGSGEANGGMREARRALNELHCYLGKSGFTEIYVDQMNFDVVAVTRHNPSTHESVVAVSHTMFNKGADPNTPAQVKPISVEGELEEVVLEARIVKKGSGKFVRSEKFINGDQNYSVELQNHGDISNSKMARVVSPVGAPETLIQLDSFTPGSVIIFKFRMQPSQRQAAEAIVRELPSVVKADNEFGNIVSNLNLLDLNHALFKCDQEEGEDGGGLYSLDGYGPLKYAGLQGVMSILSEIRPKNDLGNWLPDNLRKGNWMLEYIAERLKRRSGTRPLGGWLERRIFAPLRVMPRYLIPAYFDAVVTLVYVQLLKQAWSLMSPAVQNGSNFMKYLAMGSVQHTAVLKSALLPPMSPNMSEPTPAVHPDLGVAETPTVAAGLPHFSSGYVRSWGRDTFIALRGLLIATGRFQEARYIILGYAACLRHGLIPNLLDGGRNARFNCRDAVWWWMYCIVCYVEEVPDGHKILKDNVSRLYPSDDCEMRGPGVCDQPLEDVVQEALQGHFEGLKFRERNAGRSIDEHMLDEGFNNEIGVDLETGFVFGGNVHNCGTWMDKMGSSEKAGNKGTPASPRDGSAVEIVGLSYACLKRLSELNKEGLYSHSGVKREEVKLSLADWAEKIEKNFEAHFFIEKGNAKEKRSDLVNKSGIYKDTLNSAQPWCDYQLRCNFPIAMVVAPQLFDHDHAWGALVVAREKLLGPLGMATLDPDDWAYRGDYDNGNDSDDKTVAHGFNYHQGPEWVWPVGFFLRAYLHFSKIAREESRQFIMSVLSAHLVEMQQSHFRGIPELTNAKGAFCPGSNPIQAWSMSCIMEVLQDLQNAKMIKQCK